MDLIDRLGRLGLRVADADRGLETSVNGDIHVLIDRRAEDGPEFAAIEGGQVGAAAGEAHAVGGLRDDHEADPPSGIRTPGAVVLVGSCAKEPSRR